MQRSSILKAPSLEAWVFKWVPHLSCLDVGLTQPRQGERMRCVLFSLQKVLTSTEEGAGPRSDKRAVFWRERQRCRPLQSWLLQVLCIPLGHELEETVHGLNDILG